MATVDLVYVIPAELSQEQYDRLMDRLYTDAFRMQRLAENAWLREEFGSEQVRLVVNYLARVHYPLVTEPDYVRNARRLLERFWRTNRWQKLSRMFDKERTYDKRDVFFEDIVAETWLADVRYGDPQDIVQHRELLNMLPAALQDLGLTECLAWVWIWREGHQDSWSDVAMQTAARFGMVNVATLRKWGERYFSHPEFLPRLRARLEGEEVEPLFPLRKAEQKLPVSSLDRRYEPPADASGGHSFLGTVWAECHKRCAAGHEKTQGKTRRSCHGT